MGYAWIPDLKRLGYGHIWIESETYSLGSPGQVEVPETTSSFSQIGKALVKS